MCASLRDDARDYNIQVLNVSSDDCHEITVLLAFLNEWNKDEYLNAPLRIAIH
jgi:hypothetical protein